jgi:enoyl-CoA hydratase/carnithine racemase
MKGDYKTIKVEVKEGIAMLKLDNPPVNQLSESFVKEMASAIMEAFQDQKVKAVILTGTGKNFIAGADITEIKGAKDKEFLFSKVMDNHRFLNAIEDGPKPVIAAINGNCLGGGMEIAMACHYRIAAKGVQVGQPEVQIGLIPGAGGTQRLPRLVGLPDALQMITAGKGIPAEQGMEKGCIDKVVAHEYLFDAALDSAKKFMSGELDHRNLLTRMRTDRLPSPEEKQAIMAFAKQMATEKAKGYIAPFKAIDAIERGLSNDFEADIKSEAELFCDCAVSKIAKNLIGIFLNAWRRCHGFRYYKPSPSQWL